MVNVAKPVEEAEKGVGEEVAYPAEVFQAAATMAALVASSALILVLRHHNIRGKTGRIILLQILHSTKGNQNDRLRADRQNIV